MHAGLVQSDLKGELNYKWRARDFYDHKEAKGKHLQQKSEALAASPKSLTLKEQDNAYESYIYQSSNKMKGPDKDRSIAFSKNAKTIQKLMANSKDQRSRQELGDDGVML